MATRVALLYDDPLFLELLSARLREEGFSSLACTEDGPAAARRVRAFAPDAIVLDIATEDPDRSISLLERLTQDPQLWGKPVLLCAGQVARLKEQVAALPCPQCVILAKPYEIDDLIRLLHRSVPATGTVAPENAER